MNQLVNAKAGDVLPQLSVVVTRSQIVRYAGASTDFNPIHFSDRAARELGLPGVIAHGMWTMGAALRVVTDWIGDPDRVISYFVRFANMLVVPDTARGVVVEFSATVVDVSGAVATLAIEARSQDQKLLSAAKAQVRIG